MKSMIPEDGEERSLCWHKQFGHPTSLDKELDHAIERKFAVSATRSLVLTLLLSMLQLRCQRPAWVEMLVCIVHTQVVCSLGDDVKQCPPLCQDCSQHGHLLLQLPWSGWSAGKQGLWSLDITSFSSPGTAIFTCKEGGWSKDTPVKPDPVVTVGWTEVGNVRSIPMLVGNVSRSAVVDTLLKHDVGPAETVLEQMAVELQ